MSVFLQMAGFSPETTAREFLEAFERQYKAIPKQVSSQMLLMPPEEAPPMPPVQFPIADAQLVPAQLPKVQNQIFVMGEQHGMFGSFGLNAAAEDLDGLDHLLDDVYVIPLEVNGQLMAVGLPRSPENLMMLAGIMEALSLEQDDVQPDASSSVKIELLPDDAELAAPQPEAAGEPAPRDDALQRRMDGIMERLEAARQDMLNSFEPVQPEASGFCSGLMYVLCTPFRWMAALFAAIGRCFGCAS